MNTERYNVVNKVTQRGRPTATARNYYKDEIRMFVVYYK